jgi:hypothetical protein
MHKSKRGGQRFCVVRAASKSFAEPSRSGFKAPLGRLSVAYLSQNDDRLDIVQQ